MRNPLVSQAAFNLIIVLRTCRMSNHSSIYSLLQEPLWDICSRHSACYTPNSAAETTCCETHYAQTPSPKPLFNLRTSTFIKHEEFRMNSSIVSTSFRMPVQIPQLNARQFSLALSAIGNTPSFIKSTFLVDYSR